MSEALSEGELAFFNQGRGAIAAQQPALQEAHAVLAAAENFRSSFVQGSTGQKLVSDPDKPFVGHFDTPEDYYRFLADFWGSQHQHMRDPDMTERVANTIEQLHTVGTIAFLGTGIRRNRQGGGQLAIGRVVEGTRPDIIKSNGTTYPYELVLAVPNNGVNGEPVKSQVAITDIATRLNTIWPETGWPSCAVGESAVGRYVKLAYPELVDKRQREELSQRNKILTALCRSGMKLEEFDVPQADIDELRETTLKSLRAVCNGQEGYERKVLALTPLCETNQEALALIDEILTHASGTFRMNSYFRYDYEVLKYNQSPVTAEASS
jgi:hypothetical protein